MNIIAWIVLGLLADAIAKAIYPGHQSGRILSTLWLGILGAFVGGSLAILLTTGRLALASTTLSLPGVMIAVFGALMAIFVWHLFTQRTAV